MLIKPRLMWRLAAVAALFAFSASCTLEELVPTEEEMIQEEEELTTKASTSLKDYHLITDIVFNSDKSAKDVSPYALTTEIIGTPAVSYNSTYKRYSASFSPETTGSNTQNHFRIPYGDNAVFMNAMKSGHTVELLFKVSEFSDKIIKPFSAQQSGGWSVNISGKKARYSIVTDKGTYTATMATELAQGKYYHLIGVYNKEQNKVLLYVNEASGTATATAATSVTTEGTFSPAVKEARWIGIGGDAKESDTYAESAFNGEIVIARIYDAPLNGTQVKALLTEVRNVKSAPEPDILDVIFNSDTMAVNAATGDYATSVTMPIMKGPNKSVYYNEAIGRNVVRLSNTIGTPCNDDSYFKAVYKDAAQTMDAIKDGFTAECVCAVAYDAVLGTNEMKPFSWTNSAGGGFYIKDNVFKFQLHNGEKYVAIISNTKPTAGLFYHLAAVYNSKEKKIYFYINGELKGSNDFTSTPTFPSNDDSKWFGIGGSSTAVNGANGPFRGDVAIARLYNSAFNQDEIKTMYNSVSTALATSIPKTDRLYAASVRTTCTTASFAWTAQKGCLDDIVAAYPKNCNYNYSGDQKKDYTVFLYSNSGCSNLVNSWTLSKDLFKNTPPRFCFSGLQPNTSYYFKVQIKGDASSTSTPVEVKTPAKETIDVFTQSANPGKTLAYLDFDNLTLGGDLGSFAAGTKKSTNGNIVVCNYAGEHYLFTTLKSYLTKEYDDWCFTSEASNDGSICARPGYIKVGTTDNNAAIVTPKLTGLSNASLIRVSFKASPFISADENATVENSIVVKVIEGDDINSNRRLTLKPNSIKQTKSITLKGKPGDWKEYSVYISAVNRTQRIAIGGAAANCRFLIDDIRVEFAIANDYTTGKVRYGRVLDESGSAASNILVNDGISFCKTNSAGFWALPATYAAGITPPTHISYTTPADRKIYIAKETVTVDNTSQEVRYPGFWKAIDSQKADQRYDFTIGKTITKETNWNFVVMADPQVHEKAENKSGKEDYQECWNRFKKVVSDLNGYTPQFKAQEADYTYGMVLGDISWNSSANNALKMKAALSAQKTGTSWFTVPGNHDWYASDVADKPDPSMYTGCYGPTRYSFDRGDVHIIGINNIIYENNNVEKYKEGFTEDEYNWIINDLKYVSKAKAVILCCHAPFDNKKNDHHQTDVLNALSEFANPFIFAGHTHMNRVRPSSETKGSKGYVMEYVHAAANGALWRLRLCPDGSPAGYTVYKFSGINIKNVIYRPIGDNDNNPVHMIVYQGGDGKGGNNSGSSIRLSEDYTFSSYCFKGDKKYVYANVFIGHSEIQSKTKASDADHYKVYLMQNGKKVKDGDMKRLTGNDWTALDEKAKHGVPGTFNEESTLYTAKDSEGKYKYWTEVTTSEGTKTKVVRNDVDWGNLYWLYEKHEDITDRDGQKYTKNVYKNSSYTAICSHMWAGELPEATKNQEFTVVVETPYGQRFECSTVTIIGDNLSQASW